ncbi:UNVERIFIED_CONTAM: hypothetical protein FKN15_077395 [Acipenser sinensis]
MNTRCPLKRVPSAARFFTRCRLTVQPPRIYSVGGQRSSGQLTGKPAGARPDYRGRWCACFAILNAPEPRAFVLRRPLCLYTPCIGALGASVPQCFCALGAPEPRSFVTLATLMFRRSLHRRLCALDAFGASELWYPHCSRASVPGASCLGTLGTSGPQCIGA